MLAGPAGRGQHYDRVMALSSDDLAALARARSILEHPGLAIRIADRLGLPVEALLRRLPAPAQRMVSAATRRALASSLDLAVRSLDRAPAAVTADWLHRGVVIASGAVGGAAGLPGLLVELPFSLTVMLRSIAEHARAAGEDLSALPARLECLTVFAYGSPSPDDDAVESAYFAVRAGLARAVSQAAEYVATGGAVGALRVQGAPALLQLLSRIAPRLGAGVSKKVAAQLVPIVGAAGGAAVNALFLDHYQQTAWAHFTVRRLERHHGPDPVRAAYAEAVGPG